ncbi:hypothetical protein [Brotaphodocola sp.]|uniref:hypothetical protein n=1 Tax=Brotaphodocola sp. TaxID=3073577 RepID=UPI003D7C9ABB
MIWIQKTSEPASLTHYKKQPHAYYDGYKNKDELREVLLQDQGYICAYCMRRIENNRDTMKIEHWKAQNLLKTEVEKLDFKIMLGVCDGCRGAKDPYTTCDEHRHGDELYVNPLDRGMMSTISYDRQGHIKSSDPQIDQDLNQKLNLNCEEAPSRIVQNRRAIYRECKERLMKIQKSGNWKMSTLRQVKQYYENKENGRNSEYVGVPLYLIEKYMSKC